MSESVEREASSPGHGDRPRERCEADWIGRVENPRRSLEDRSCLGVVPTESATQARRFERPARVGEAKSACGRRLIHRTS